ncbi:MAG: uracil-xanthine permease family protein [Ndongobacter sp.]|nr:uracil-xanthine permease family protein [Ndongobacter sp.]
MSNNHNRMEAKVVRDCRELSVPKRALLSFQHVFAMFGATILVPILTGIDISTALFMAGAGTLFFHWITKGRVPAFLGSSFAFIAGYNAITHFNAATGGVADPALLSKAHGGVVCAGLVYLVFGFFIRIYGAKRVMRFFPPVVTGPIIISIGLILAPVAIQSCSTDWLIALIAIGTIIFFNIWGRGMTKIIPIMLGGIVASLAALLLNRGFTFDALQNVPFIKIPLDPRYFATFDFSAIITIVPISIATMMEHIGDISAIGATTGENYIENPGLHRTLVGDGLATSLSAFFGGPANTTYGENTGVLVLTKVYDPRLVRYAACVSILLSVFPGIAAVIYGIPASVIGGISLVLYGMISAIGIRNMVENQVDLTLSRNLLIAAGILVSALGFNSVGGLSFAIGQTTLTLSGLAVAALVGIVLNIVLPGKDFDFEEERQEHVVDFSGITEKGFKEEVM